MRLIDVHSHVQLSEFDADRKAVIDRSLKAETGMIIVGTNLTDSVAAVRLAEQYPNDPLFASVGIHPNDDDLGELNPRQLAEMLASPKVVAIGECGLDYYRLAADDDATRTLQADAFELHVLKAIEADKPLIIHTRDRENVFDAYEDMLAILRRHHPKFVMHCYSGDWARAEQFLELGGFLSFTGIITFPKAETMQDVARRAPLDRILVETDAPFLAPVPHRGERNEPAYVAEVAKKIAELRGISVDDLALATLTNSQQIFQLPE